MATGILGSVRQIWFAFGAVYLLVYATTVRAYTFDTPYFGVAAFLAVIGLSILALGLGKATRLQGDWYTVLLFLFMVDAAAYLVHYDGFDTLSHIYRFFAPAAYFVTFRLLFHRQKVTADLFGFFKVVFIVETAFIVLEIVDGAVGFDVHGTRLIGYFIDTDERFRLVTPQALDQPVNFLPPALGLHGFPHYTAPIYVVAFLFTLARAVTPTPVRDRLVPADWRVVSAVLFLGLFCIYMLGVKMHLVAGTLAVTLLAAALRPKLLGGVAIVVAILAVGTIASTTATERFLNLVQQTFVGTTEAGGSRIDVIFNLQEYMAIFEQTLWNTLVGSGEFSSLLELTERGFYLEQRFLIVILVFGIPYLVMLMAFFLKGFHSCWRVYRDTPDPLQRALAAGIGCSMVTYFLELFHYGFTLSTPNFQFFFIMLAAISVVENGLRAAAREPQLARNRERVARARLLQQPETVA